MSSPLPTNPSELFSPFLPTTFNTPEEDDRLDKYLVDNLSNFADTINDKRIGTFTQDAESFNGEKWIYLTTRKTRTGYQTVAYIPSYPNAGVLVLNLGSTPGYPIMSVNPEFVITQTYGTASLPCSQTGAGDGNYITYVNRGDPRIFYDMTDTTITITTTINMSRYSGFIVINYVRDGL